VWGQVVILLLIQIGGLGIMILSFFTIFVFRQSVSVESKLLISYMLSENNMTTLSSALRRIILITFGIELGGALLLLPLMNVPGAIGLSIFRALFHSISAFCNAGFALFSDSLEGFVGNVGVNLVIGILIIAGGLSFAVISNGVAVVRSRFAAAAARRRTRDDLSVNTRAVLIVTGILLTAGMLLFYALEHHRSMAATPTGIQYLAAFFQSITLRTAGFNTVPLGGLTTATYLVMMAIMFVGGASGSTAGGIKVNTVAVIGGYLRSRRRGRSTTVLFNHTVREDQVAAAFTVLMFGVVAVGIASVVLSLTESFSLTQTMFESVSAFATVGLTTGITGSLSIPGRVIIVVLMFIGRVGPLTLFSAFSARSQRVSVSYPTADISVG
jgi:trk system potassium uptake protein TrkH